MHYIILIIALEPFQIATHVFFFFSFIPCFSHFKDIHIKKMFFHKNRNTQIQVYTIQCLELETDKTCEAYSIVH